MLNIIEATMPEKFFEEYVRMFNNGSLKDVASISLQGTNYSAYEIKVSDNRMTVIYVNELFGRTTQSGIYSGVSVYRVVWGIKDGKFVPLEGGFGEYVPPRPATYEFKSCAESVNTNAG